MSSGDPAVDLLRVYHDPDEIAPPGHQYEGYPYAWFEPTWKVEYSNGENFSTRLRPGDPDPHGTDPFRLVGSEEIIPIKDQIRGRDRHRCLRCGHPFIVRSGLGRWSPCDELCTHGGPVQITAPDGIPSTRQDGIAAVREGWLVKAEWRILTVHHLNGVKHDCRWWNLVSLCQRDHLVIQAKVWMHRPWVKPHSEWFQPFAAGFYAWKYLDLELSREETMARLEELLALEQSQDPLF